MRTRDTLHTARVGIMNILIESLSRYPTNQHGRILVEKVKAGNTRVGHLTTPPDQPRGCSPINDNYCVTKAGLLAGSKHSRLCFIPRGSRKDRHSDTTVTSCRLHSCKSCTFCNRAFTKEDTSPVFVTCFQQKELKYMKDVPCIAQLSFVRPVTNAQTVASNLPVGARLQNLAEYGCWSETSSNPQRGLRPTRLNLTRSPTIISCYVNPHRNLYLSEVLYQLMHKNAVQLVQNQKSLGFFNQLYWCQSQIILDLSKLNLFLKVKKFKMETPETIRTSLQQGEWVTSIDFKEAYFHKPIQEQSRKYLRFHIQGRTYQFKALPFGLSTAPMEFTVIAKEVKLMAIHKGVRIH